MIWRALRSEFGEIRALSLRDRDDDSVKTVGPHLQDTSDKHSEADFLSRKWRRRYLESYLIVPAAIGRAAGKTEKEVKEILADEFSLSIARKSYVKSSASTALLDLRGKEVLSHFKLNAVAVAKKLEPDEVCEDLALLTSEICGFI